jgi:hypothetical protein
LANPTTNYGFVLPTPTDLVTDLPADFEVALQGVDTQMFTNANAAVSATVIDAKGDLLAGTAADTLSRIAVGANATVLTADSAEATGMKWAAAAGNTDTWTVVASSALNTLSTITVSSLTYNKLMLWIVNQDGSLAFSDIRVRFNGSTTAADYDQGILIGTAGTNVSSFVSYKGSISGIDVSDSGDGGFWLNLTNGNSTSLKPMSWVGGSDTDINSGTFVGSGTFNGTSAITSLTVFRGSGTWTAGTLYVYGA